MIALLCFLAANALAAASGAYFRPGQWYQDLDKPGWRPPDRAFGPVWAILYVLIAVAGWLVWQAGGAAALWPALAVYGLQLVLNALWSAIFFGAHRIGLACIEVVLLWLAIAATAALFWPVSQLAAWLMAPYLVWVGFAVALNFSVWRRNRT